MNKTFHPNNYHYNGCVGYNGHYDIETYALGYAEAVQVLIKETIKFNTTLDAIIYPIFYSARHYIELTLKYQLSLLSYVNRIVDPGFNNRIRQIHYISELWNEFKELASIDKRYKDYIFKAEEYIRDFIEIDNSGETFRYPYSKDDNRHLAELYSIDVFDFGQRFEELNDILEEMVYLTHNLIEEYKQKSIVSNIPRNTIKEIAQKLPPISTWKNSSFKETKEKLKKEFSLSSNKLSKIIRFIKNHREFSSYINNEMKIKELEKKDLEWFLKVYDDYIEKRDDCKGFVERLNLYINKISNRLKKEKIAALAQLYDIGYFMLYSEEYDIGLESKMKETKAELIRIYLLGNGIVKEKIKEGLTTLGQRTLLKAFN